MEKDLEMNFRNDIATCVLHELILQSKDATVEEGKYETQSILYANSLILEIRKINESIIGRYNDLFIKAAKAALLAYIKIEQSEDEQTIARYAVEHAMAVIKEAKQTDDNLYGERAQKLDK